MQKQAKASKKPYKSIQKHTNPYKRQGKREKSNNKNLFLLLRGRDTPSHATKASSHTPPPKWRRMG